ncbi:hypothetical protein ACRAWD_26025 [Caulobacter segnis]
MVYETIERVPSVEVLARLDAPLTALLHSPRAARILARLLNGRRTPGLRVLCLSEAVAEPLAGLC